MRVVCDDNEGVEDTFLRLTMVDKIVTSYKADDGYDELSRYWDDDMKRPGSHQDPEKNSLQARKEAWMKHKKKFFLMMQSASMKTTI